ncbi:MAG TPA: alkaline phosphatase family protein [Ktedonobacteraceae bacterium]|nr:alkaline phosphatase family protein [Ktedonobacteraceae bacterium]
MTKVVMLGISGLDPDLLRVYGSSLPAMRHLMLESPFLECRSSFPPVPVSAWATIYTGRNPANHGISGMNNREDFENREHAALPEQSIVEGETFWDMARRAGKRVFANTEIGRNQEDLSIISLLRKPDDFCRVLYERTSEQAARSLKLLKREPWDLFFLRFDALDYVQHLLWRYSDPADPGYPGSTAYAHLIADFYALFDRITNSFRAALGQECVLVIASGYGFGRRCIRRLQVNEWLRGRQLLAPRSRSQSWLNRRYLARRRNIRPAALFTHLQLWGGMPESTSSLTSRRDVHHKLSEVLVEKTVARLADLAGTSPFGGIRLNRACIEQSKHTYEQVRMALLEDLTQLRVKGQRIVNWVKTREDVYSGKFLERFPDILFELRSDFGVDTQLYVPLVTQEPLRRFISGERTMSGVLLLGNLPERARVRDDVREPSGEDVAPTILSLLDIASANLDGKALIELQPANIIP